MELVGSLLFMVSWMEKGHWKNSAQSFCWSALELASRYSSRSSLISSGRFINSRYLAYLKKKVHIINVWFDIVKLYIHLIWIEDELRNLLTGIRSWICGQLIRSILVLSWLRRSFSFGSQDRCSRSFGTCLGVLGSIGGCWFLPMGHCRWI